MNIRYSPESVQDLEAALDYLAARSPAAARALLDRLEETLRLLSETDVDGPARSLASGRVVRSWPINPYTLFYRRGEDALEVVRVYQQARRPI